MNKTESVTILVAEDDDGHAALIRKNLVRAGLKNDILRFADGQAILDFLFCRGPGPKRIHDSAYMLFLDIRMPKVDGVEVLRQIKSDHDLRNLPVVMLTTTEDPREVERCHAIGCNSYVHKPVDYENFVEVIKQMGLFLLLVKVPLIDGQQAA